MKCSCGWKKFSYGGKGNEVRGKYTVYFERWECQKCSKIIKNDTGFTNK